MTGSAVPPDERGDAGFTLVEVLAALAAIGTVLTAVTTFFIRSMVTVDVQGSRQVAAGLAEDGMARLRTVVPASKAKAWLQAQQPEEIPIGGLVYERSWLGFSDEANGLLPATVRVQWKERGCDGHCVYQASTLLSVGSEEPVFEAAS